MTESETLTPKEGPSSESVCRVESSEFDVRCRDPVSLDDHRGRTHGPQPVVHTTLQVSRGSGDLCMSPPRFVVGPVVVDEIRV